MCSSNIVKPKHSAARLLLPLLLALLISSSSLVVGLGNALKAGIDMELSAVAATLNIGSVGSESNSDFEQLIEAKLNESASQAVQTQKLLSRKRRYLIFPEGSSFQMVFDEIVCIVDYTNYLVLGITVALAWELPSKPPSEALEDLKTKLNDGTLDISRNDTVSNITYVNDVDKQASDDDNKNSYKPNYINLSNAADNSGVYNSYYSSSHIFHTPMHPTYQHANSYYRQPNLPARRKDSYYYYTQPVSGRRDPFQKWSNPYSRAQNTRYPYWALSSHLKNTSQQKNNYLGRANNYNQRSSYYGARKSYRQQKSNPMPSGSAESATKAKPKYQHKIFPVFGKRSIPNTANPHHRQRRSGIASLRDESLTKMEGIQIKYHRNSRQTLFGKIEQYLDKRGQNGHQCVLRTLCETGQKSHEEEPGNFLSELLRVVFTIPEVLDHEPLASQETSYDKAHNHHGNCAAIYPECTESIWNAPFIQ